MTDDRGQSKPIAAAPTAAQMRKAAQERASSGRIHEAHTRWKEDPFGFLAGMADDDDSLRKAVVAAPVRAAPESVAVRPPTAEELTDQILKPLHAERRTQMRKRSKERSWLSEIEAQIAAAIVLLRQGNPAARQGLDRLEPAKKTSRARMAAHDAAIAAIEVRIAARRAEIVPIIASAVRGQNGWRVVNGHVVNPKGRRLISERGVWERASYQGS